MAVMAGTLARRTDSHSALLPKANQPGPGQ